MYCIFDNLHVRITSYALCLAELFMLTVAL